MESKAYSYIRFSTPEQLKGDSLRRQLEASETYAKNHGLILDNSLNLRDLGLSAFHGTHKTKGALSQFFKLIEKGQIPKGSTLIVENLDRLSRQEVLEALNQFTNIIQAGIKLVTLQDGMVYSKEAIIDNWSQLIISITYMARAHDESKRKSQRLSSAWEEKRAKANKGEIKMTAKAPLWLKLSQDKKEFILIPEAQKALELIFKLKLNGKGNEAIERELNRLEYIWKPPFNIKRKSSGWRKSYISKILSSRAVIGEFIPLKNGVPQVPIPNYYPPAIDTALFYQVQSKMQLNGSLKGNGGGKTGKATNLFVQILKCGLCGSPMHYIDKGKGPKGAQYLHCDNSHRKTGKCEASYIRYDEFEKLIFENLEELNISELLPDADSIKLQSSKNQQEITALSLQIVEFDKQTENLLDSVSKTNDSRIRVIMGNRLVKIVNDKEAAIQKINSLKIENEKLLSDSKQLQTSIDASKEIYSLFKACKDENEKIDLRLKLRGEIRTLINNIKVWPLQEKYVEYKELDDEPGIIQHMNSKFIDKIRIEFANVSKRRWLFLKSHVEV